MKKERTDPCNSRKRYKGELLNPINASQGIFVRLASIFLLSITLIFGAIASSTLNAAFTDIYWTGSNSGFYRTFGNWTPSPPTLFTERANFDNNIELLVDIDVDQNIGSWRFGAGNTLSRTITKTSAFVPTVTFRNNGDAPTITNNSTATHYITGIKLNFESYTYIQAWSGDLNISSDIENQSVSTSTLHFRGSSDIFLSGVIADSINILKGGSGTTTLSGANTFTGSITASGAGGISISSDNNLGNTANDLSFTGGTLTTTSSLTMGSGRSVVVNSGGGTFDVTTGTLTVDGVISGTGALTKKGLGTLDLQGVSNAITGGIIIDEGTLRINADNNLGGTSGDLRLNGATLDSNGTLTMGTGRSVVLGSGGGTFDVASGTTLTIQGVVSGSNSLTKSTGSGTLVLSGTNTFTGAISLLAGDLSISSDSNLGNTANDITLNSSGKLIATDNINMGSGRDINIASNADIEVDNNKTLTIQGVISGGGNLDKLGAGTLELTGTNTFAAPIRIQNGILEVNSNVSNFVAGPLGNSAHSIELGGSATNSFDDIEFRINTGGVTVARNIYVSNNNSTGDSIVGGSHTSGTATFSGTMTLLRDVIFNTANLTIVNYDGVISGSGHDVIISNNGTGTSRLDAASTYTGDTILRRGSLVIGQSALTNTNGALGNSANNIIIGDSGTFSTYNLSFTADAGGTKVSRGLTIGNQNTSGTTTIGGSHTSGTVTFSSAINLTREVQFAGGNSTTTDSLFTGVISGTGDAVVFGAGTTEFTNTNTYTGDTIVRVGTLRLGSSVSSGVNGILGNASSDIVVTDASTNAFTSSAIIIDTAGVDIARGITVNNFNTSGTTTIGATNTSGNAIYSGDITLGRDVIISTASGGTLDFSGNITGSGGLTKTGDGDVELTGTNTFTGDIVFSGGELGIIADNNLGNTGNNLTLNSTSLLTRSTIIIGTGRGINLGSGSNLLRPFTGTTLTVDGVISGSGNLVKHGQGDLVLTGTNTYTGTTTVRNRNLIITEDVLINTNGILGNSNSAIELGDSGTGTSNTLRLLVKASDVEFARDIDVNNFNSSGATIVGNDITSGTVTYSGDINLSKTLQLQALGDSSITISGKIAHVSGNSVFNKIGSGAVILTNATNDFTGNINIREGTVQVNVDAYDNIAGALGNNSNNIELSGTSSSSSADLTFLIGASGVTVGKNIDVNNNNTSGDTTIGSINTSGTAIFSGDISLARNVTISTESGGTIDFDGVISGTGDITKIGDGDVDLTGTNTFTGDISFTGGELAISADNNLGNTANDISLSDASVLTLSTLTLGSGRDITLSTGENRLRPSSGTTLTVEGAITGSGDLVKFGAGDLVLINGSSNYTGDTIVRNSTLQVNVSAPSGSAGALGNAISAVELGDSSTSVNANLGFLIGASGVTVGRDIDVNNNNSSGDTTIGSTNTNGTATFSGGINLARDAILATATGGTVEFSGILSGTGGIAKTGLGTVVLSGDNTFTGAASINDGTLEVAHANALSGISSLTFNGSVLHFTTTSTVTAPVVFNSSDSEIEVDSSVIGTLTGVISETGGSRPLLKTGAGTLSLSGTNTYTGVTTVQRGTLRVTADAPSGSAGTLGNATSAIELSDSGIGSSVDVALDIGTAGVTVARDINVNNFNSSGFSTISSTNTSGTATYSGDVALSKDLVIRSETGGTVEFSGVISGASGISKRSGGTAVLSGSNTFTGAVSLNAGRLRLAHADAISNASSIALGVNTVLQFSQTSTFTGPVTINASTGADIEVDPSVDVILSGVINGTGVGQSLSKLGEGKLTLSGVNTYTGITTIGNGTLEILSDAPSGSAGALGNTTGVVTLGGGSAPVDADISLLLGAPGLTVGRNLNIQPQNSSGTTTVGSTATSGTSTFSGNVSLFNDIILTSSAGGQVDFTGVISGSKDLTISGGGTILLAGTNTFNGDINVDGGSLSVSSDSNLGSSGNDLIFSTSGSLIVTDDITFGSGRGIALNSNADIDVASGKTLTINNGPITGSGQVNKLNSGTLVISGTNNNTQAYRIHNGTLEIGSNSLRGSAGALGDSISSLVLGSTETTVSDDIAFRINTSGVTMGRWIYVNNNNSSGTTTIGGSHTSGSVTYDGRVVLSRDVIFNTADGTTVNFNDFIIGAGGVVIDNNGTGISRIDAANTYTGDTTIRQGGLIVGRNTLVSTNSALGNSANNIIIGDSGTLAGYNLSFTADEEGTTISRGLTIGTQNSSGTTTLGGSNTSGTITFSSDISLTRDIILTAASGGEAEFSGILSGSNGISKTGLGTIILSGNNTFTGAASINDGTLEVAHANALSGISSLTFNGSVLHFTTNSTITAPVVLNSSSSEIEVDFSIVGTLTGIISETGGSRPLVKTGAGTLSLSGTNTYTGITTVRNGTLRVTADAPSGSSGTLGNATSAIELGDASTGVSDNIEFQIGTAGVTVARDIDVNSDNSSGTTTISAANSTGTVTYSGNIALNKSIVLSAESGGEIDVSGVISGGFDVSATSTGSGGGTITYSGTNTYTGATNVNTDTTLNLDNASGNVIAAGAGDVTVTSGGTLLLARSNQVGDDVNLILDAGTLAFGASFGSESLGTLSLTDHSVIDFANTDGVITFSGVGTWDTSKTLIIRNWDGIITGGGNDQLQFADASGLTAAVLDSIYFEGYGGTGRIISGSPDEVTPQPEPGTVILGIVALGVIIVFEYRRRSSVKDLNNDVID